jgi:hypothetical protein
MREYHEMQFAKFDSDKKSKRGVADDVEESVGSSDESEDD